MKDEIKVKSSPNSRFNYYMMVDFLTHANIHFKETSRGASTTDFEAQPALLTIYPKSRDELTDVVKKLNELNKPFHIVSAGHNWGYGDSNLINEIEILIHLSFVNQILNYNNELGTVEIEPGVTQHQLSSFLANQTGRWVLDITGADRSSSVIGNFLERGFGHTSAGDHERASKIVEVLTVDGKTFCPHLVSMQDSHVRGLYQHDVSLNLDRIFYQTHFAIVTRMVIHLKPKYNQANFCTVFLKTDEDVAEAVAIISRLKAQDVVSSVPHIGNASRIQKTTTGPVDARMKWVATIDISGPAELVHARKKILKHEFAHQRKVFFSSRRVEWLSKLVNWLPKTSLFRNQFENLKLLEQLYSGIPSDNFVLNSIGKDTSKLKKMNWIGPLFPSQADHFLNVKQIVTKIFQDYGLTFSATVSIVSSRCAVMITEVTDAQNTGIPEQILKDCYTQCHQELWQNGYPIYRYGLRSGLLLETQLNQNPEYLKTYQTLKHHFDPNNLLSRGRWGIKIDET